MARAVAAATAEDRDSAPASPVPPSKLRDRLPVEIRRQIVDEYSAGERAVVLAERFGISRGSVMRFVHEAGVPLQRPNLSPEEIERAVALYADGWSLARIGHELGRDQSSIRNVLIKDGVRLRDAHGRDRPVES